MPDATSNLDLWIEIAYDSSAKVVRAYLTQWHVHTNVPWPSSMAVSAKEINDKFHAALDPMIWKPNDVFPKPGEDPIPDYIHILSVKVMSNGDLNVYIEPLCAITTACIEAKALADDCPELETLRAFRDEYIANQPGGKEAIDQYYWIAPQIVNAINQSGNPGDIYTDVYERLVQSSVALIRSGKMEEAYENCRMIIDELREKYLHRGQ